MQRSGWKKSFLIAIVFLLVFPSALRSDTGGKFPEAIKIVEQLPGSIANAAPSPKAIEEVIFSDFMTLRSLGDRYSKMYPRDNRPSNVTDRNYNPSISVPTQEWKERIFQCMPLSNEFGDVNLHVALARQFASRIIGALNQPTADYRTFSQATQALDTLRGYYSLVSRWTDERRANEWNSNCVGFLGIDSAYYINLNQQPTVFTKSATGYRLILGAVESGYLAKLESELSALPSWANTIYIGNGGGGNVVEAIAAGRLIRQHGKNTTLHGECVSACALVFLGGKSRSWGRYNKAKLGFHQISSGRENNAVLFDNNIYKEVEVYLNDMGLPAPIILSWMRSASPNKMYYPTLSDLCKNYILYSYEC